jgi:sulfotransferase family protein
VLPSFIIGGTLPAGTGHLYSLLVQHPEVYLPRPMQPECNFFFKSDEYERGLDHYRETWFCEVGDEKAIGERSSLLLSGGERTAERVAKDLPQVKLIFLLRDPVLRAYANYRFTALAGHEELDFETALATEEERMESARQKSRFWGEIQPHSYFSRGLYAEQLAAFQARFPAEQLLVMRSDELHKAYDESMDRLWRFLGVSEGFRPGPVPDFSSPAVRDVKTQAALRSEAPQAFDAAIQRVREGSPPASEFEERVRENLQEGYDPLPDSIQRDLASRYREPNRLLATKVSFSISDWLGSDSE